MSTIQGELVKDFQSTIAVGYNGFEETEMFNPEVTLKTAPTAVPATAKYRYVDDGDSRIDWSGIVIVVTVLLAVVTAALPQFEWFQELTGISSWIQFSKNVFGWR